MGIGNMNLGSMFVNLRANTAQFHSGMAKAEASAKASVTRISGLMKRMGMVVGAGMAAMSAISIKAFGDFDDAVTQSTAIMGNMSASLRAEMEMTARTIAKQTVTTATELGKAYYFLASAGLNAKQSIAALNAVEKFSVAGMFDMSLATDLLTDAQSALGLTVKDSAQNMKNMTRVSDVLVKANTLANASVQQFAEALTTKSAAALRKMNKEVEEGIAVLAAFADQGTKGSEAGEKLHIVIRDLGRAASKGDAAWKAMGLRLYDANEKMLPLYDIIGQLETVFDGMTDKQKAAASEMLGFQDRSFAAIQMLFGTSEKIKEYERQLRKAGGTTETVANKQLKSFWSQMKIVKNQIVDIFITIGGKLAPALSRVGVFVKKAASGFGKWAEAGNNVTDVLKTIFYTVEALMFMKISTFVLTLTRDVYQLVKSLMMTRVTLNSLRTVFAGFMAAVAGWEIGAWLSEEFMVVQLTMANFWKDWMTGWSVIKYYAETVWSAITKVVNTSLGNVIRFLATTLSKMAVTVGLFDSELSDKMLKMADKMGTLGTQILINENKRRKGIQERHYEELRNIETVHQKSIESIKKDFEGKERKGKSFTDFVAKDLDEINAKMFKWLDSMVTVKDESNKVQEFIKTIAGYIAIAQEKATGFVGELIKGTKSLIPMKRQAMFTTKEIERAQEAAQGIGEAFATGIEDAIIEAKSFKEMLGGLLKDINKIVLRLLVTQPLADAITSAVMPATQVGAKAATGITEALTKEAGAGAALAAAGTTVATAMTAAGTASGTIITGATTAMTTALGIASSAVSTAITAAGTAAAAAISLATAGSKIPIPIPSALGNIFSHGSLVPFQQGGVVDRMTAFPMRGGNVGVMGEKGPEAIMPLSRGDDGKLGIKSTGKSINQYITIQATDAGSFHSSRRQILRDARQTLGGV